MHLKAIIKIGEFLCSHFNIEDGRKKSTNFNLLRFIILKKVKMKLKRKQKICEAYGESAMTDHVCKSGL